MDEFLVNFYMLKFCLFSDDGDTCYAKLLLASPGEVLQQVNNHVIQSLRLLSAFEYKNSHFVKSMSTRLLHQKRQLLILSLWKPQENR